MANLSENQILLKLEEDGFITPNDKAEELLKNLTKPKCLYALKILFEDIQNKFSSRVTIDSLKALADPTPFDHYSEESAAVLELYLRTWAVVLERICFSPIRLSRECRESTFNSLAKFSEIHRKTTQVIEEGLDNNFKSNLNINQQQKNDENYVKKRNYNIDFLLIHLRDTLHSLRDAETWFEEILRRVKDILKAALGVTSTTGISISDNSSILTMLSQLRQGLSFKYPVASYYVDWRIMLIIQHNINKWSSSSEKVISKKFGEMILMEYFWSYVEREWIDISDKSMLDSQTKFDEISGKVMKALNNTGSFLNDLLVLPHTLWFGILDLAHNLIQTSTRTATYGLCYYLAIESLNKSPSSFIQFKAIEILLHLHNINNELFSMIDLDFDQYIKKLSENNSSNNYSSKKFQNLLSFVKEKYLKDLEIINNDTGKSKGKGKEKGSVQNISFKHDNSNNILDCIANEITCPITYEPADQLCILECQHVISLNNLKKLKQAKCPTCQQKIVDNNIRYLSQNTIYKNLYSQFFEAGHILPSIETEDSGQNQYNSNSDESEEDVILTKKRQLIKSIKFNSNNVSLQSIFQQFRNSKKQHPVYLKVLEELNDKNYEKAALGCKELLKIFPKSYSIRCILAYTYRCFNKYDDALFYYLKEAIDLKEKNPIAWYIRGEIFFRQNDYKS